MSKHEKIDQMFLFFKGHKEKINMLPMRSVKIEYKKTAMHKKWS